MSAAGRNDLAVVATPQSSEVRLLTRSELRATIGPLVDAFWCYEETVHLLPEVNARTKALPRYLLADARDSLRFNTLLGATVDGAIVGAAAWLPPHAYPIGLGRQGRQVVDLLPSLPWSWRAMREARNGQLANRRIHRSLPPHFYLRALGVTPSRQGMGLGSLLVSPVVAKADAAGVGCFLTTTTAANVAWYQGFDFEVTEAYRPTATWPLVWAMWRPPRRDRLGSPSPAGQVDGPVLTPWQDALNLSPSIVGGEER